MAIFTKKELQNLKKLGDSVKCKDASVEVEIKISGRESRNAAQQICKKNGCELIIVKYDEDSSKLKVEVDGKKENIGKALRELDSKKLLVEYPERWLNGLDSIKDGNLGKSKLKVGQKVHLDPSYNDTLRNKALLDDTYEILGFWYDGKVVNEDIAPDSVRDFSGVKVKNLRTGTAYILNRFQFMDSIKDSVRFTKDELKNMHKLGDACKCKDDLAAKDKALNTLKAMISDVENGRFDSAASSCNHLKELLKQASKEYNEYLKNNR